MAAGGDNAESVKIIAREMAMASAEIPGVIFGYYQPRKPGLGSCLSGALSFSGGIG